MIRKIRDINSVGLAKEVLNLGKNYTREGLLSAFQIKLNQCDENQKNILRESYTLLLNELVLLELDLNEWEKFKEKIEAKEKTKLRTKDECYQNMIYEILGNNPSRVQIESYMRLLRSKLKKFKEYESIQEYYTDSGMYEKCKEMISEIL